MGAWGRVRYWHAHVFYSVRGRATVMTVSVAAVILAVCVTLAAMLARDAAENGVASEAERTVERIGHDLVRGRNAALATKPDEAELVQVVRADQTVLAATEAARGEPALAAPSLGRSQLLIDRKTCPDFLDDCVRVFGLRLSESPYGADVMLYAAAPLPTLSGTWLTSLIAGLALLLLLALIGWRTWRTVGLTLEPVEAIRLQIAGINAGDLDQRVPVPGTGGEIQMLAETVNETLERLEEAMGRERRFISDASHDLRNPIAGLHTRLESALDEPEDFDWRSLVRAALADTRRLNDIIVDLLELSRLDSRAPLPLERVDLGELARREVDHIPRRVPVALRSAGVPVVEASPGRLTRVLANLLSNAERHAEAGILVTVSVDGPDAVVEVLDDGAGIAEESRERVFERFARLSESRSRDPAGTGLGLPIAREIAEIYGGSLRLADSPKGARFVLRLPLAGGASAAGASAAR